MFTLQAVTDTRKTDVTLLRSLLLAAALWIAFHDTGASAWFRHASALVLLLLALLSRFLLLRTPAGYHWQVFPGALLLLASTRNLIHTILFVLFAYLPRLFYGDARIQIGEKGISLPRLGRRAHHDWKETANVVLKDGLLTIDFVNNRLIQLPIDGSKNSVDELDFNNFCSKQLALHQNGNSG